MMMKIAIPTENGKLTGHFGQAAEMYFCTVDDNNEIVKEEVIPAPPHAPGVIPRFVKDNGATHIIVSGLGAKAQSLFESFGIKVAKGAPEIENLVLVKQLINDTILLNPQDCHHDHSSACDKH